MRTSLAAGALLFLVPLAAACGRDGSGGESQGSPARGNRSAAAPGDTGAAARGISDIEFRAFVRTSSALGTLRSEMLAEVQTADDAEERRRIRRHFRAARDSLLRGTRLEGRERYREIRTAVENDEGLRRRWRELRARLRSDSAIP